MATLMHLLDHVCYIYSNTHLTLKNCHARTCNALPKDKHIFTVVQKGSTQFVKME